MQRKKLKTVQQYEVFLHGGSFASFPPPDLPFSIIERYDDGTVHHLVLMMQTRSSSVFAVGYCAHQRHLYIIYKGALSVLYRYTDIPMNFALLVFDSQTSIGKEVAKLRNEDFDKIDLSTREYRCPTTK